MEKPILKLEKVSKLFNNLPVLKDINFELKKGEIVVIIGPSGAGKTVLLRCIAMLEPISEGRLSIDGEVVEPGTRENKIERLRKKIGVVFQEFHLWPHKTVLGNIIEPLVLVKKLPKSQAIKEAKDWLAKVDLLAKEKEYPDVLSGGEKQRAAIARTLAMEPKVVLLDEITSALDPELVGGILKIIKRLAKYGITMLVVTHHMRFAREIADRIIFLDKGEVVEENIPEIIFEKPEKQRTEEFLTGFLEKKKQEINIYEGYEDFQAYHLGLIKRVRQGCTGYVVGAVGDRWFECMGDAYLEYKKIFREKKIVWKWVSYKLEEFEREVQKQLGEQLQISLIPKEYATPANFNIWEDTIILQTFGEPPAVIEIRNEALTKGYLNYFNLLWEMGEKLNF